MKNNLLDLKPLKPCNIDPRLPANDFLELVVTNKMEEGDFIDTTEGLTEVFERAVFSNYDDENEDHIDLDEENYRIYWEKLKNEFRKESETESNSDGLLYAGYVDCMDEAIRFLVEEENISPEHPVVKNLKAHLEKSKEKILDAFSSFDYTPVLEFEEYLNEFSPFDAAESVKTEDSTLNSIFFAKVRNCRDSG